MSYEKENNFLSWKWRILLEYLKGLGFDGWCRKLSLVWDPMYGRDIDLASRVWPLASFLHGLGGGLWGRERGHHTPPPTHLEHGWVISNENFLEYRTFYFSCITPGSLYDEMMMTQLILPPPPGSAVSRWWGLSEFLPELGLRERPGYCSAAVCCVSEVTAVLRLPQRQWERKQNQELARMRRQVGKSLTEKVGLELLQCWMLCCLKLSEWIKHWSARGKVSKVWQLTMSKTRIWRENVQMWRESCFLKNTIHIPERREQNGEIYI